PASTALIGVHRRLISIFETTHPDKPRSTATKAKPGTHKPPAPPVPTAAMRPETAAGIGPNPPPMLRAERHVPVRPHAAHRRSQRPQPQHAWPPPAAHLRPGNAR